MEAADLSRWTRFAAKGGIGKCTAIQDCVAESPEDLMFLKDDEITVLMQLPGQSGRFLGYCEGVVGRFQGDHVHFHGKLKRPVMTKRSSSFAASAASSPVPSVTPSPRIPLTPLPATNVSDVQTRDRDSTALSDPFDLELDAKPKVRASEDTGNRSDSDGDRRRFTRLADDLPGLEMFLPRSRSGSRSRPTSSRGLTDDEKGAKRRTRIVAPPQLQTAFSHADSHDAPPSPLPPPSPLSKSIRASPDKSDVQIELQEDAPRASTGPENLQDAPVPEKDVSSLYDGGSMRSSIYSTTSYRSSVFGPGSGLNATLTDAFGLLSQAESDDGELGMGIGLTMLQDMADDDEEDSRAPDTVPPTPRPIEAHAEDVQDKVGGEHELNEEQRYDDEDDEEDDDDSYWDGADIYDSYRYSRYSVMTKNSRRKSRVSMMSRNSVLPDVALKKVPPIPLDTETHLRSDSALSGGSAPKDEHERRKHVPPPLNFAKSISVLSSVSTLLSVDAANVSPSSKRSTTEYSAEASPLLHTTFSSPRTSGSHVTNFGTDIGDTPSPSPSSNALRFAVSGPSANGSGIASALRQRLENDRSTSPTPVSSPLPNKSSFTGEEIQPEDNERPRNGIVVDDDEPVSVTVVPAEEGGTVKEDEHEKDNTTRDSVQSTASAVSNASVATSASDYSVTGVMRKLEADLASGSFGSGPVPSVDSRDQKLEGESQRTPNASTFSFGTTQPLRLQDRVHNRSAPPVDQGKRETPAQLTPAQPNTTQPPLPQIQQEQPSTQREVIPPPSSQLLRPEQALFLPHPNAPRPNPAVLSGQRQSTYGMPPVHDLQLQATRPSPGGMSSSGNSLQATLRAAFSARVGPAGVPYRQTIFGKTVMDLANSDGPVPMVWSLQPFPVEPISRAGSPASGSRAPRRAATAGASPLSQSVSMPSTPPSPGMISTFAPGRSASPAYPPASQMQTSPPSEFTNQPMKSNVIPRTNFSPQVGAPRPRSRSFSGFAREIPMKLDMKERASEEGNKPTRVASVQSLREAAGSGSGSGSNGALNGHPLRQSSVAGSPPNRGIHTRSPLSRPENNAVIGTPRTASLLKGIPSPLGRSFFSSSQTQLSAQPEPASNTESNSLRQPILPPTRNFGVRQVASVDSFKPGPAESPLFTPPRTVLQPVRRNSGPAEGSSVAALPQSTVAPTTATSSVTSSPIQRLRRISSPSSKRHQRTVSQQSQTSSTSDPRSAVTSPPPTIASSSAAPSVQRSNSIKSKLSLSHLRIRNSGAKDSLDMQTPSPSTGPATPVFDFDNQPETVHVQDAEFEMIRPTLPRVSTDRVSEDSAAGPDERASTQRDASGDSPVAASVRSVLSPVQSTIAESVREREARTGKASDDASMHNARELKWISAMSAVPPAQARKNRKIRRLVFEGVPSSVRYLVWGHLTDSKAKRIPGVYGQLGRRGRVAATEAIERDASRCFPDQPHLQDPKGPLVGLLQTYLTMVPDIAYQTSLALVAGHLLLQSPEEDAFWIFTSMMDLHLRTYFSSKSVQMEADAITFGKTVESLNPQLAKKLFMDLAVPPLELCRIWFSSLFATTLPQDYVNRVWDVYLYEGPSFLFRVGFAILSSCRTAIEETRDRTAVLAFLSRPESRSLLPDDPEELINLAMAVKLKDEDIRKQRVKVEQQLRQQTQPAHRSAPRLVSSISLPRSKPVMPL